MRIIFLCLFSFWITSAFGQHKLTGIVQNADGEKLVGASVFLQASKYATTTDEFGFFEITDVQSGDYILKITYLTYEPQVQKVSINSDTNLGKFFLEGGIYGLDAVEIKSTWVKNEQPFAFQNIDKETIAKNNLGQDVPFALKWTPSAVVTSDAGAGVGYTGIRIRGSDPTRINVTINGIPLNDAESQGVFWVDLPDFLSSVDQIQIQRGVGTSTNGAGAFGASINLKTSRTTANSFGKFSFGYGSFDTRKTSIAFGSGLMKGKYSVEGKFASISSDGYIDRSASDLTSIFFSAARLTKKSSLRLNLFSGGEITQQAWNGLPFQFLESDRTYNPSGTEKADAPYANEVDDYGQSHMQLLYDRLLNKDMKLNLGVHYTRGKGFFEQYKASETLSDYFLQDSVETSDLVRRRWLDNHFYGAIISLEKNISKATITAGGAVHNYLGRHFGNVIWTEVGAEIPSDHTYYDNDADKLDANVFAKIDYQLQEKLNGYLDLQLRRVNYNFIGFNNNFESVAQSDKLNFFNPKLGLTYQVDQRSNLFASIAVANKEPNRNDYTESSIESRPKHETLYDLELGYRMNRERFALDVNLYNMVYNNQLVLNGQLNDVGAYTRVNVPNSFRRGVELGLNAQLTDWVSILPTATLSQNKIKDHREFVDSWDTGEQVEEVLGDTDLSFSPSVIFGNQLIFNFSKVSTSNFFKQAEVIILTKYVGKQFIDNTSMETSSLDAYSYTDLRVNWSKETKLIGKINFYAQLNNVFNSQYTSNAWIYRFQSDGYDPRPDDPYARQESEGRYNLTGLYPQAGLNFMLGLSFEF